MQNSAYYCHVNAIERVIAALNHQEPDRVPIWTLIDSSAVMRHFAPTDVDPTPLRDRSNSNSPLMAEVTAAALEGLGIDATFLVGMGLYNPFPREAATFQVLGSGSEGFTSIEDVRAYTPEMPTYEEIEAETVDRFRKFERLLGPDVFLVDQGGVSFDWAHNIIGLDLFCLALYDAPSDITRILEAFTERERIKAQVYANNELSSAYQIGGDIAGKNGVFFSPDYIRREIMPLFKRQIEPLKEKGIKIIYHSDGNIMEILDDLVDAGIDGLNPIETTAGMDLGLIKKRYGKNLVLIGNVDANIMTFGTPEEVAEDVRRCIRDAAAGGGFCLDTGAGEIMPGYPVENVIRFCEAAYEYGKYPLGSAL